MALAKRAWGEAQAAVSDLKQDVKDAVKNV